VPISTFQNRPELALLSVGAAPAAEEGNCCPFLQRDFQEG